MFIPHFNGKFFSLHEKCFLSIVFIYWPNDGFTQVKNRNISSISWPEFSQTCIPLLTCIGLSLYSVNIFIFLSHAACSCTDSRNQLDLMCLSVWHKAPEAWEKYDDDFFSWGDVQPAQAAYFWRPIRRKKSKHKAYLAHNTRTGNWDQNDDFFCLCPETCFDVCG